MIVICFFSIDLLHIIKLDDIERSLSSSPLEI